MASRARIKPQFDSPTLSLPTILFYDPPSRPYYRRTTRKSTLISSSLEPGKGSPKLVTGVYKREWFFTHKKIRKAVYYGTGAWNGTERSRYIFLCDKRKAVS
jgi:hypothetical protein